MLSFNQNQKHSKHTHNIERVSECKKLNKNIHFARMDTEKISTLFLFFRLPRN
jgi:hypothetical protein